MKESKVENQVCEYAESKGFLQYKFVCPNRRGVPDRIFFTPSGKTFFIEFKTTGGTLNSLQTKELARLTNQNVDVHVTFTVNRGKEIIDAYT